MQHDSDVRTWQINVNGKDCEVYVRYPGTHDILQCDPEFRDDGTEDCEAFVIWPNGHREKVGWDHFDMESDCNIRFETSIYR